MARIIGKGESKWCKDESRVCKEVIKILLSWVRKRGFDSQIIADSL